MGKKIQCIGRYAMDGVTLGKGSFATVELATHGLVSAKVCFTPSFKRWWIPIGARLEGPKLEPEGPRAKVGFPTADPVVFEHSGHYVWLLWHLSSVGRLQHFSTPSMDKCK